MRYQIVYCKRGWPLTTWADNVDRARKLAERSAALAIPSMCGNTPKTEHKKPTSNPAR